jgi:protein-arginine deiminase
VGQATVTLDQLDDQCLAGLQLDLNSAGLEAATVEVSPGPYTTGEDIQTEITRLELGGFDPAVGNVIIRERTDRKSGGRIENVMDDGSGGFASGSSYFDLFVEVELPDQGLRLHTGNTPIRMEAATITQLPPIDSAYLPPFDAEPAPLYDAETFQHVGWICHNLHKPTEEVPCYPPPPEEDWFLSIGEATVTLNPGDNQCLAGLQLALNSAGLEVATVEVGPAPYATGVEIQTEITQLELGGFDPAVGNVIIRERTDRKSRGKIENVVDDGSGGFASGSSYFDLFVEVELADQGIILNTGNTPIRMEAATITELPPIDSSYLPPFDADPAPLYDAQTFQHVGWICHNLHKPAEEVPCYPPPPEEDWFLSTGEATVTLDQGDNQCLSGSVISLSSAGFQPATVEVDAPPYTTGVDIQTEITQLELGGFDGTLGNVIIRERADRKSTGRIENVVDDGSGGFASGSSRFDVFVEVELPGLGMNLHTGASPIRLEATTITELPPIDSAYLPPIGAPPVPLYDEVTLQHVGWLCHSFHLPEEEVPCTISVGCEVDLDVDTDRDTKVDDTKDEPGEDAWTKKRGATFLNNVDDDNNENNNNDPEKADNRDAAIDDKAKDGPDLAEIVIRAEVADGDKLTLEIVGVNDAKSNVRIFDEKDAPRLGNIATNAAPVIKDKYDVPIAGGFPRTYLVEALDFPTSSFKYLDLKVTLDKAGGESCSDQVRMRVAPYILLSNPEKAEVLYYGEFGMEGKLKPLVTKPAHAKHQFKRRGVPPPPTYGSDGWPQDEFEIGFTRYARTKMHVVWDLPRNGKLDKFPEQLLLNPDTGHYVLRSATRRASADFGGNIEVSFPVKVGGKDYLFGRAIVGSNIDQDIKDFLGEQEVQAPIIDLNVSWLAVGHVDEIMCIMPGKKVLIADTDAGLKALEDVKAAHGAKKMFVGKKARNRASMENTIAKIIGKSDTEWITMANGSRRKAKEFYSDNEALQTRLDQVREDLRTSLGLRDRDMIRIPMLFDRKDRARAYLPDAVNGQVVNGTYIAGLMHAPVIKVADGDFLQKIIADKIKAIPGIGTVEWVDGDQVKP